MDFLALAHYAVMIFLIFRHSVAALTLWSQLPNPSVHLGNLFISPPSVQCFLFPLPLKRQCFHPHPAHLSQSEIQLQIFVGGQDYLWYPNTSASKSCRRKACAPPELPVITESAVVLEIRRLRERLGLQRSWGTCAEHHICICGGQTCIMHSLDHDASSHLETQD